MRREKEQASKYAEQLHELNKDDLFTMEYTQKHKDELEKNRVDLINKIEKLREEIEKKEGEYKAIYANAFEWRFEFPEVLDDDGNFLGFDVVIGNPPYGVRLNFSSKKYFSSAYSAVDDIYTLFIEKGISITKQSGFVAFIIPMFWLTGEKYFATRKFIYDKANLDIGINLPYDIFIDAYVDTGIYIFSNCKDLEFSYVYEFEARQEIDYSILNSINFSFLKKTDWIVNKDLKIIFNPLSRLLINKFNKIKTKISDVTESVRGILAKKEYYSDKKIDESYEPIFVGKIDRYSIEDDTFHYIKYGENLEEKPSTFDFFTGERLLIRRIISRQFRIMATITDKKFVNKKDIYIFKIIENKFSGKYLLAILNSNLISFIKTKGSASAKKDDFTQLTLSDIRQLAIPEPDEKQNKKIIELADEILNQKKQNPKADTSALEKQIDEMVYQLYGLTEEEIKIVEGME